MTREAIMAKAEEMPSSAKILMDFFTTCTDVEIQMARNILLEPNLKIFFPTTQGIQGGSAFGRQLRSFFDNNLFKPIKKLLDPNKGPRKNNLKLSNEVLFICLLLVEIQEIPAQCTEEQKQLLQKCIAVSKHYWDQEKADDLAVAMWL